MRALEAPKIFEAAVIERTTRDIDKREVRQAEGRNSYRLLSLIQATGLDIRDAHLKDSQSERRSIPCFGCLTQKSLVCRLWPLF